MVCMEIDNSLARKTRRLLDDGWIHDRQCAGVRTGWIETYLPGRFEQGSGICMDEAEGAKLDDGGAGDARKVAVLCCLIKFPSSHHIDFNIPGRALIV
jgi:hypothetical protein